MTKEASQACGMCRKLSREIIAIVEGRVRTRGAHVITLVKVLSINKTVYIVARYCQNTDTLCN